MTKQARLGPFSRLWLRISEPRVLSIAVASSHLVMMVAGIGALIDPPLLVDYGYGAPSTVILCVLYVWGGCVGMISALTGSRWLERTAILALCVALAIYGALTVVSHLTSDFSYILKAGTIFGFLLLLVGRFVHILGAPWDPDISKKARQIAETGPVHVVATN